MFKEIIFLDDGKIECHGSFDDCLSNSKAFARFIATHEES
jgi:hypothetical protein